MDLQKYHSLTATIVWSIIGTYYNKAHGMYLHFENELVPLLDFFAILVPHLGSINWPFDKEEIGRIWHHLHIIPEPIGHFPIPEPDTSMRCEDLSLRSEDLAAAVSTEQVWCPTINAAFDGHEDVGAHGNPSSEVRISTFHTEWFLCSDPYVKRVRVIGDAAMTRLFIDRSHYQRNATSYHITWIPHLHMKATKIQKRSADDWSCIISEATRVFRPNMQRSSHLELKALIWNVRGTVGPRFTTKLREVMASHQPMMLILTGTSGFRSFPALLLCSLGFSKYLFAEADPGHYNGFWIFWIPSQVEVYSHEYYVTGKHVTIKVLSNTPVLGRMPATGDILKLKGKKHMP